MRKLEISIEIISQKGDLEGTLDAPQIDLDGFGLEIAIDI
jgi:hypothetical protein